RSWEALHQYRQSLLLAPAHQQSFLGALKVLRGKGQYPRVHQMMIRLDGPINWVYGNPEQ
ncbi:Protein of unknown function, partial [Gryllus bimaculatus]